MISSYELASATALLLAGGLGTRLRGVLDDRPKALAPVGGRPFLAYLLDQVARAGIGRAVICTGHLGGRIRGAFGDRHEGVRLVYSHEPEPLGTGGALRLARGHVTSSSVLVMNGDSYCETDLFDLWDWHHVHPAHVTVVTTRVDDARSFGRLEIDSESRVRAFAEKSAAGGGTINAGLYLMHTALLERIPDRRPVSLEVDLLPGWVAAGGVYAYPRGGAFLDIGTPERLARAERFVRASPSLRPSASTPLSPAARHTTAPGEPT